MMPKPRHVRFQTSQRGVHFRTLAAAKEDFMEWLETGESPAGAETQVHIWQNEKEKVIESIGHDPSGEVLRATLRGALRDGRLRIHPSGKSRKPKRRQRPTVRL